MYRHEEPSVLTKAKSRSSRRERKKMRRLLAWQWRHFSVTHALSDALWSLLFTSLSRCLPRFHLSIIDWSLGGVPWARAGNFCMLRGADRTHAQNVHCNRLFSLTGHFQIFCWREFFYMTLLDTCVQSLSLSAGMFHNTKISKRRRWQRMFFSSVEVSQVPLMFNNQLPSLLTNSTRPP